MSKITPEPRLAELLNIMSEECAEVIQAVSKINRFGLNSPHPFRPENSTEDFIAEYSDLLTMMMLITKLYPELVRQELIEKGVQHKLDQLRKYSSELKDITLEL